MTKRSRPSVLVFVYGGSVLLHGALAVGAIVLPKSTTQEAVAIELREAIKKPAASKLPAAAPPPPPVEKEKPPPPPSPRAAAKVSSAPKAEAPPPPEPAAPDGFTDLGVAIGHAASAPDAGPAAAASSAAPAATAAPAAATTRKVEQLVPARLDQCTDPVLRPRRTVPVAPKYTLEARQAEVEGVVRVEVTVDEAGRVVNARVLNGLGYGLDEAALTAARASVFMPASRCGRPVIGTIVLPFRFQET